MKTRSMLLAAASVALLVTVVFAAEKKAEKKDPLKGIKCVVNSKNAAKAKASIAYKGGKVNFCCGNCLKAFKANPKKFATKANHQLYATGQVKLVKCVVTGKKLNTDTAIKVAGTEVCFCCAGCKKKAESADDTVQFVFNDKSFAKGFELPKSKKEKK